MSLFVLASGKGTHPRPAPVNQGPLPPLDTTGTPTTTLSPNQRALPSVADKRFWRENAWSMTIPNLPWLAGATSSKQPERCLTWFLGASAWQPYIDTILTTACLKGYTHFTLSWPDCRDYCGMSVAAFTALASYVKSWGFYVHVKWWAKNSNTAWSDPQNSTWAVMQPWVTPVLSSLMNAGAIDCCSPWEWNANNIAGPQGEEILDGVCALVKPAGVDAWIHFSPEVTWWGADGSNRFDWWRARMAAGHVGIHYQAQPPSVWDMGTRQARYLDSIGNQTWVNTGAQFVAWEADGVDQFDNAQPDEATSAMHAYLDLCTPGIIPVSGFGDGCWLPDGTPTLSV